MTDTIEEIEKPIEPIAQKEKYADIKAVIKIVKEIFFIVLKFSPILITPIVLLGLYGYFQSKKEKPVYTATLSFFLSEDRPMVPSLGAAGASVMATNYFAPFSTPRRLKEYSFTEKVGSLLLFRKEIYKGKEDFLINHFLREIWGYKDGFFVKYTSIKDFDTREYLLFKRVLGLFKTMVEVRYSESDIYSLNVTSVNEEFSLLLCNSFYETLIAYYIERTNAKAYMNVKFLTEKLSQVNAELTGAQYQLADHRDRSNNLVTNKAGVAEIRYMRSNKILEEMFIQTAQALETAKTNVSAITPLFQTIDEPHLPLAMSETDKTKKIFMYLAIGFAISIFIVAFIFVRRHFGNEIKEIFKS